MDLHPVRESLHDRLEHYFEPFREALEVLGVARLGVNTDRPTVDH